MEWRGPVVGFVGKKGSPLPVSKAQYEEMIKNLNDVADIESKEDHLYDINENIRVKSGSFQSFEGTVDSIDSIQKKLVVSIKVFDREISIELGFDQVEKI